MENFSSVDNYSAKEKSPLALRTIGEVSEDLDIAPHVLRFWESKFSHIDPIIRRGRRYYRAQDIRAITQIKSLLYGQGYTIKGAQKFLLSWNPKQVDESSAAGKATEKKTTSAEISPATEPQTAERILAELPVKMPALLLSDVQILKLTKQLEEIQSLQNDWQKFLGE